MVEGDTIYDALVVGGGPAGLAAAICLARFKRSVALYDAGEGRSTFHQINYNYLGFPGGVAARELRRLGREQLAPYAQVRIFDHKIDHIRREGDVFCGLWQGGQVRARTAILCTGVIDHYPHFPGWEEYVGRSMYWCVTCDGYQANGKCVVVTGIEDDCAAEALQLTRFASSVALLTDSHECGISETFKQRMAHAGIPLICDKIESVTGHGGYFEFLTTMGGQRIELDQLFSVQGTTPESQLADDLGLKLSHKGYIVVDKEQQTSEPGVFAAGDCTRFLAQLVATAVHEGSQAAAAANYYLYPPNLKDPS